jgi:hypothetical protein
MFVNKNLTCSVESETCRPAFPTACSTTSGTNANGPGGSTVALISDSDNIAGESAKSHQTLSHNPLPAVSTICDTRKHVQKRLACALLALEAGMYIKRNSVLQLQL